MKLFKKANHINRKKNKSGCGLTSDLDVMIRMRVESSVPIPFRDEYKRSAKNSGRLRTLITVISNRSISIEEVDFQEIMKRRFYSCDRSNKNCEYNTLNTMTKTYNNEIIELKPCDYEILERNATASHWFDPWFLNLKPYLFGTEPQKITTSRNDHDSRN